MKIAKQIFLAPFIVLISTVVYAQQVTPIKAPVPPVDPLTAQVNTADAERFAKLFDATGGTPTAAQIQKEYLTGAGRGVEIFTPYRITDAATMAAAVAKKAADYSYAITTCLPLVASTQAELRAGVFSLSRLVAKPCAAHCLRGVWGGYVRGHSIA